MSIKNIFNLSFKPLIPFLSTDILLRATKIRLILPFYHAVSDNPGGHIKNLYPVRDVKTFKNDLDNLLKIAKPISLDELISINKSRQLPAKPVFHLTIDDGFSEFKNIISPILLNKGIPATCFLNTGFIDNKNIFFRCKASLLIDTLHNSAYGSYAWKKYHDWHKKNKLKEGYYKKLILSIKYNNRSILDSLANDLDFDFNAFLTKNQPYLSSLQINELIGQGFTFGVHTIDHPDLNLLSLEEGIHQIVDSYNYLSKNFKITNSTFSVPFSDSGLSKTFFDSINSNESFEVSFGSSGFKKDTIPNHLQRISIDSHTDSMESLLKQEIAYYFFLFFFGKQKIIR